MKWYVLQVMTGKESEARDALADAGIRALVPTENRLIRFGGEWKYREYRLFPGYVFVRVDYGPEIYRTLLDTKHVVRILSCGAVPSPLTDEEALWVEYLGCGPLEPSAVVLEGGGQFRVVSGPLTALENHIVKLDRHRRRVRVRLTIAGHEVTPEFSVEIRMEKDMEGARVDSSPRSGNVRKGSEKSAGIPVRAAKRAHCL